MPRKQPRLKKERIQKEGLDKDPKVVVSLREKLKVNDILPHKGYLENDLTPTVPISNAEKCSIRFPKGIRGIWIRVRLVLLAMDTILRVVKW